MSTARRRQIEFASDSPPDAGVAIVTAVPGEPSILRPGMDLGSLGTCARRIKKFVCESAWAHVHIAGTAWATRRAPFIGPDANGFGMGPLGQWPRSLAPVPDQVVVQPDGAPL